MDPVQIFKQRMTAAIAALPDNTAEARAGIYRKTREFVAFSRFANLGGALEEAIADIERGFDPAPRQPDLAPAVRRQRGAHLKAALFARARGAASALARLPPRIRLMLAGGLAALVIAVGALVFMRTPPSDPDFDKGFADYSSSARGFDAISSWTSYYVAGRDGDVTYVEAKGPAPLYSREVFPVVEGKTYRMTTRIRVMADDAKTGGSLFYVGTVSYDRRGNPIGAEIAPAQYFVMNVKPIKAADGWVTGEGTIVWNGPDPNTSFPEGTTTVRLAAILNSNSPDAIARIDYLRFEPVQP